MDPRRLLRSSALALAATGLLLSGCTGGGSGPSASATPAPAGGSEQGARSSPSAELKPFYGQKLSWRKCGTSGFECATLKAPLDYDAPGGETIKLAVARKKATGPGSNLGSLHVNPGGPGGSGVGFLQSYAGVGYPAPVRARYDMVAMDPRGVARSEPVECLDGKGMDAHTQVDQTPDTPVDTAAFHRSLKNFAAGCEKKSGKVLPHVSTADAARDMDVFRAALGDPKLTYVGASYGTFLGATYAELFPTRTGRLVLDGAMDPSLSARQLNLDQTEGFETAFQSFAADCVKRKDCPLGRSSTADAGKRLKQFFTDLDQRPVPTGDDRELGESLATTGVLAAMYDEAAWPQLRTALTDAMDGRGTGLLTLADAYYEREPDGTYSNLMFANAAVNCLDSPPAFPREADMHAALPDFERVSPVFGRNFAWAALNCSYWPTPATGTPHRITAEGAPPILVVGTTRDPATPYKWSRSLASQLSSGRLLTYDGDGHTAYNRGSDCVDTAINTYLLEGTPPQNAKRCR
ncbi:alpha/beta hydrolase [Streptomyces sp. NPDC058953]|uniref:alpha/beta hydrolase n=1 Tax=unclassified Streptomyces TaxID=2593676 RepID=UPI003673F8D8